MMFSSMARNLALVLTPLLFQASGDPYDTPERILTAHYQRIRRAYVQDQPQQLEQTVRSTLEALFDLNRLAPQLLPDHWRQMNRAEQARFVRAFTRSLTRRVQEHMATFGLSFPELEVQRAEISTRSAAVDLVLVAASNRTELGFSFLRYPDGRWLIGDVRVDGRSLRGTYYSYCKEILKDYSPAYLIAEINQDEVVVLEDFEGGEVGQLPPGWTWKKSDEGKHKPYRIEMEGDNRYLAARDEGESVILGKEVPWNLKKYPYISFRWRVHRLPEGGDERYSRTNDSGAAVYVFYKRKLGLIPETVKYVWSSTLPVGAYTQRSGPGRPWNIVVESGSDHLGEWRTYTFNAYQAYKDTYAGEPPERALGIAVLSDANSTHSKAYADYDDILALKSAQAGSGARQRLEAE